MESPHGRLSYVQTFLTTLSKPSCIVAVNCRSKTKQNWVRYCSFVLKIKNSLAERFVLTSATQLRASFFTDTDRLQHKCENPLPRGCGLLTARLCIFCIIDVVLLVHKYKFSLPYRCDETLPSPLRHDTSVCWSTRAILFKGYTIQGNCVFCSLSHHRQDGVYLKERSIQWYCQMKKERRRHEMYRQRRENDECKQRVGTGGF